LYYRRALRKPRTPSAGVFDEPRDRLGGPILRAQPDVMRGNSRMNHS